ncbi:cell division protein FtsQ/DivIB [Xanthomarina sp. F1114]|uniref:cell division protein FtsQ/DivIB n=1 Tax=Xanthomarina sp. F1114 TaxID=2996019 RepID=UPI00225E46E5|nr:cell division protein FtsQ/DivIB [Xanthomarina sp. F1114]MCX7546855.1 cell division protein FtsQ/DivIB [Xanthomarina sp. F1114]
MQINWNYIKMIGLLCLVVFLYAFSSGKNKFRKVPEPIINFQGDNNLFLTRENVSKLLIQNTEGIKNKAKESLDLNVLESALNSNQTIKSAQVYLSVNGLLTVDVEQKKPIARVRTNASYYIDDQGSYMPLSSNYSARVPLVTGKVAKNELSSVFKIAKKVNEDEFLKKHVIEIHQIDPDRFNLKLRQSHFTVQLGDLKNLDKKIMNLKAFYNKALKEKLLDKYANVNLQFESQVVCTKI